MDLKLTTQKIGDEKKAYKNCILLNPTNIGDHKILILNVNSHKYHFLCVPDNTIKLNYMGMTLAQRKWTNAALDTTYNVTLTDDKFPKISKVILEVDFLFKANKSKTTDQFIESKTLSASFVAQFFDYPLTVEQTFYFVCNSNLPPFEVVVSNIEIESKSMFSSETKAQAKMGILLPASSIIFKRSNTSTVNIIGDSAENITTTNLINPDWNFGEMGIGGLDKEFNVIFRRAFASRLFPPHVIQQLGMKHVRGILLYGPPGTGKTLMARQIGKMLNAREPKIVHGPDILNKFVGESEANIRKLFAEAEEEQKKAGINSALHIIIFDEIDAICKKRGSTSGGTGVHDTVVNQLLSKIDGVEQLNNVLIIGMTNRKDLIDDALLRPGRLEVQLEISLPDENGRLQILSIHTSNLQKHKKLDKTVDLPQLAAKTKNFSGAEIEGLVKAATSIAMNRAVKLDGKVKCDPKGIENLTVTMSDFEYALKNDIKPMFGASTIELSLYIENGIVNWCNNIQKILSDGRLVIEQTKNGGMISPVKILLYGDVGSGKTALAAQLALTSNFPLIKLCSADQMVGFLELTKCNIIRDIFDDASKSELSCIVIDNIERILEYVAIGPRFSNTILQALMVLLNKPLSNKHKLLVIATTSCLGVIEDMGLSQIFTRALKVPIITKLDEIEVVVKHYSFFSEEIWQEIMNEMVNNKFSISIPLKKLISICEMAIQDLNPKETFIELMIDEKAFF